MAELSARPTIQIKGIREGLLVTLSDGDWLTVQNALLVQIEEQRSFFQGAKLALDVGNAILHAAELGSLRDKLSDKGISLWAVISNSPTTDTASQLLGLATRLNTVRPDRSIKSIDTSLDGEAAVMVQRNLRSGFTINFEGHVCVMGDVNPGAEIRASGNVIIWGRLKGGAHAGEGGNGNAVVCALDMTPTVLRIADVEMIVDNRKHKPGPQIARLVNGKIEVQTWDPKER
ncbi:MAG TPA: septum site-determining protein MinC [Longilinea sp.]|nr:septum site-determining protein MinC [Longilinea sp.]